METYNEIKENWEALKIKLKQRYPQLTDGDLELIDGYEHETFRNLEAKTGKSENKLKTEMQIIVREL